MLDQKTLKGLLHYDPETGVFTWLPRPLTSENWTATNAWNASLAGTRAGCGNTDGYNDIRILGKSYLTHRLAWLYMTGKWPTHYIDHKNGDRLDNSFANLREANPTQNSHNRRKLPGASSRYKGVCWNAAISKWQAQIRYGGRYHYLGVFKSEIEAAQAYASEASRVFGEFANAEGSR